MPTRKQRGYDSQRLVAGYLQSNGFPFAESTGAGRSGTDITGCPGIDIEVKARRGLNLLSIIKQLDEREAGLVGVGVIRPDGMGPATVGSWPTVMTLAQQVRLLRLAGYGESIDE